MNTKTVLTGEQINEAWRNNLKGVVMSGDQVRKFARDIEQAVLQSKQVQEWKQDSVRLDWLESSEDSHGFCHAGYGDYIYYAHQETGYPSVREVIDIAMEQT